MLVVMVFVMCCESDVIVAVCVTLIKFSFVSLYRASVQYYLGYTKNLCMMEHFIYFICNVLSNMVTFLTLVKAQILELVRELSRMDFV